MLSVLCPWRKRSVRLSRRPMLICGRNCFDFVEDFPSSGVAQMRDARARWFGQ